MPQAARRTKSTTSDSGSRHSETGCLTRAGATTSAELMAAGKAALMIPLPGQLEQRRNAEVMQESGAARMILQDELTGERLAREIASLVRDPERLTAMERASRSLARGDAAAATVDLMEKLVPSLKSGV